MDILSHHQANLTAWGRPLCRYCKLRDHYQRARDQLGGWARGRQNCWMVQRINMPRSWSWSNPVQCFGMGLSSTGVDSSTEAEPITPTIRTAGGGGAEGIEV